MTNPTPKSGKRRLQGPTLEEFDLYHRVCRELEGGAGSLSDAAKKLGSGYSLTRVSQCIGRLENLYGLPRCALVERSKHGPCKMTERGRALFERATQMLAEYERCKEWTGILEYEVIKIGTLNFLELYALPQIIEEFYRTTGVEPNASNGPLCKIDFVIREFETTMMAINELDEGRLSLVLGVTKVNAQEGRLRNIRAVQFRESKLGRVVLVPRPPSGNRRSDPFAKLRKSKKINLAELTEFPLCFNEYPGSAGGLGPDRPERRLCLGSLEAVIRFVAETRSYVGIGVPWDVALKPWKGAFDIIPLDDRGEENHKIGVYYRENPPPSKNVEGFIDCAKDFFGDCFEKDGITVYPPKSCSK